ncbi:MAG: 2Fe-2S iron-sulfur cluster-binding protein [Betaproteobacteria bacterium]
MSEDTFVIDGRTIPFAPGDTILTAAAAAGVYIPHLCWQPGYAPHGSCKVCTVIVDGRPASACTMKPAPGSIVENDSPPLNDDRRALVEMLFVEGNHICPACEKTGDCQLQAVGYHLGMAALRFEHFYPPRSIDASHPDVFLDRNRCILCELCVRASRDVDGKSVFGIGGRGLGSRVIVNAASGRLADTNLSVDDVAVHVCPVGAILVKRHAYEVPIGQRTYDLKPIAEVALAAAKPQAVAEGSDD